MRRPHASAIAPATAMAIAAVALIAGLAGRMWWTPTVPLPTSSVNVGFAELGQRDTAIAVWHQALAADTGSALVLGQLAALHLQRAREGGGWEDYRTAEAFAHRSWSRRQNRNGSTAVTLVNALLAQHRFGDARIVAAQLVARESDIPEYRALMGEVAMELGDDTLADRMFRSVWRERAQLSMAPRVARWLELTNHVREARVLLIQARTDAFARRNVASETKAWFALRLGDLEMRAGNTRGAEAAYREGLRVEPGDPRLFAAMARLELERDHADRAIAWGERAITLQLDPATLGLLGNAYAALGDRESAERYLRTLDVAVSTQPGAYHRAWALSLLDHQRQIETVLAKAQAELQERRDVYGYDVVAWALYQSGRLADANVMMARAMRLGTPDPLLHRHARAIAAAATAASRVATR